MPLCWPRLAGLWKTQVAGAPPSCYFSYRPGVAELADAADSKSAGALLCVGSTPSSGTNSLRHKYRVCLSHCSYRSFLPCLYRASPCFKIDMIDDKDGLQTNGIIKTTASLEPIGALHADSYKADPRYFPAQMQF